jgi:glycosyltransferase involved in cell wall biosynthesis
MRAALIIPCYNEETRLDRSALLSLLDDATVDLVLVDDGSTDGTRAVLDELARPRPDRVVIVGLDRNAGKGEAVRRGLRNALAGARHAYVGYLDADLATPPAEIARLLGVLRGGSADVVLGSRVALLGRAIERHAARHYVGRIFGTLASMTLQTSIYDTQCGAKLFRASRVLRDALDDPFLSRWAFDIELLGRLLVGADTAIWEEPLLEWRDVAGSKLSMTHMARSVVDLVRINRDLTRRRAQARRRAAGRGTSAAD